MEQDEMFDRLVRYVTSEASADEVVAVERWLVGNDERVAVLAELRAIWHNAQVARDGWNADVAWSQLQARMNTRSAAAPQRAPLTFMQQERPLWTRVLPIAAVIGTVAIGGTLLYRSSTAPLTPPAREYATGVGERSQLQLDDGTRVTLGVASRLHVEAGYGRRERTVHLEGTALFDVPHDAARPFTVRTELGVVQDLGTRFDVRAYPADSVTQVVVAEGLVALKSARDTTARATLLEPGQMGVVNEAGRVRVRANVDVARYHAWSNGRLVFESTPLAEALPELARWYGLEFRLADSALANIPLTATFADRPSAEVLDLIALSLDLRIVRSGRTITFHSRKR